MIVCSVIKGCRQNWVEVKECLLRGNLAWLQKLEGVLVECQFVERVGYKTWHCSGQGRVAL